MEDRPLRALFRLMNRYFMVPMFRLGLGQFVGNPFSGYIMVIKTTGRRTGKKRYVPVNYAILNGRVYCLSGWGQHSHWYRNLEAQPSVELILPSGPIVGIAETVTEPDESMQAIRQLLRNAGIVGFSLGFNPATVSDEELREKTKDMVVFRIRPTGIGSGPADPGGWLWILGIGALLLVVLRKQLRRCCRP